MQSALSEPRAYCGSQAPSNSSRWLTVLPKRSVRGTHPGAVVPGPASGPEQRLSRHYVENFFGSMFADRLMREAGLADEDGRLPRLISTTDFWMLCLASINEANDENHGCTSRAMPKSTWTLVFSTVNQMETLGAGLRRFAELVPVIPSGLTVSVTTCASAVKVTYGVAADVADVERAERYAELMAVVFHCVILWGSNRAIRPLAVRLPGALQESDGSIAALLSPKQTREGEGTTVFYRRGDMALPLGVRRYKSWASHETSMFLELVGNTRIDGLAEEPGASVVVTRLRDILTRETLSQQEIARAMGMSVATLQRRLAEAGQSFRSISRDVRVGKLRSLLATDSPLDDIAMDLGFSERRSLWRACHDWLGLSPAEYRRMIRLKNRLQDPAAVGNVVQLQSA